MSARQKALHAALLDAGLDQTGARTALNEAGRGGDCVRPSVPKRSWCHFAPGSRGVATERALPGSDQPLGRMRGHPTQGRWTGRVRGGAMPCLFIRGKPRLI